MSSKLAGVSVLIPGTGWVRGTRPPVGPPTPPPTSARFPGDNAGTGMLYVGSSEGTGDGPDVTHNTIAEHEASAGTSEGAHRQFFSSPGSGMYSAIQDDHAHNRLPVISFKVAQSAWAAAGTGGSDAVFDSVIATCNSYAKPVVISINHEPENDYPAGSTSTQIASWTATNAPYWRAMQARFRSRINHWKTTNPTLTNRVTFAAVLMSFTWATGSGRNPADWWAGDGVWDVFSVDHYAEPSAALIRQQWTSFVSWAQGHNIPIAVSECGLRRTDTTAPTKWYGFFQQLLTLDAVWLSYFDSNQNDGSDGYILDNTYGLHTKFHATMRDASALHLSDLGY